MFLGEVEEKMLTEQIECILIDDHNLFFLFSGTRIATRMIVGRRMISLRDILKKCLYFNSASFQLLNTIFTCLNIYINIIRVIYTSVNN